MCIRDSCPSDTRVLCDETKEYTADILIPHEMVITLVFWYQQRLVGDVPFHLKFVVKSTHPIWKAPTSTNICYNVSTVRASNNIHLSRIGSRPQAFQQAIDEPYGLPLTPPDGSSKREFVVFFVNKNQCKWNKLYCKVSLCEDFQRQSCSRTIPLSNGVSRNTTVIVINKVARFNGPRRIQWSYIDRFSLITGNLLTYLQVEGTKTPTLTMMNLLASCVVVCCTLLITVPTTTATFISEWAALVYELNTQ